MRKRVGTDFPVLCRMSGDEYVDGGLTIDDTVEYAGILAHNGADALHISACIALSGALNHPPYYVEEGVFTHLAAVKQALDIPVITVGRIRSPVMADEIIREGKADLVSMGRTLPVYAFMRTFMYYQAGLGSALAVIMIVIPFYVLIKNLGLANTHFALILAYTAFCLPFSLWLLRAFFQSIPMALEEAALTDGAGRIRAVIYVILPLALPGIIATGIFTFILAWNDYIFVRILITSDELKTLPVGIADLYNATVIDWGMIMAGSMLISVPVLVFFVFVQRYLIAGWGSGGMKA